MNYSEIRGEARGRLKGNWTPAVLGVFVYLIITGTVETISMSSGFFGLVCTIGFFALYGPLEYGLNLLFMKLSRRHKADVGDLFAGFNSNYSNKVNAGISIYFYTFLWSLLLIIPGIVASYSYSMTYFIMIDNPNLPAGEAIKRSKEMTRGHKWELFVLDLTFIGWMLLSILTFGIGMFWVSAYMKQARAQFYHRISGNTIPAEEFKNSEPVAKVMSEEDVDPFNENADANVIYRLKCKNCGATETHTQRTTICPYCGDTMQEE